MSFLFVFRDKCFGHRPTQLGSGLEQSGHRPQSDLHPWTSLACESSLVSLTTCPPNKELRDCLSLSASLSVQPVSALATDRPKSPSAQRAAAAGGAGGGGAKGKAKGKKGKGGKTKPEPPEETDPRKLELLSWVRDLRTATRTLTTAATPVTTTTHYIRRPGSPKNYTTTSQSTTTGNDITNYNNNTNNINIIQISWHQNCSGERKAIFSNNIMLYS